MWRQPARPPAGSLDRDIRSSRSWRPTRPSRRCMNTLEGEQGCPCRRSCCKVRAQLQVAAEYAARRAAGSQGEDAPGGAREAGQVLQGHRVQEGDAQAEEGGEEGGQAGDQGQGQGRARAARRARRRCRLRRRPSPRSRRAPQPSRPSTSRRITRRRAARCRSRVMRPCWWRRRRCRGKVQDPLVGAAPANWATGPWLAPAGFEPASSGLKGVIERFCCKGPCALRCAWPYKRQIPFPDDTWLRRIPAGPRQEKAPVALPTRCPRRPLPRPRAPGARADARCVGEAATRVSDAGVASPSSAAPPGATPKRHAEMFRLIHRFATQGVRIEGSAARAMRDSGWAHLPRPFIKKVQVHNKWGYAVGVEYGSSGRERRDEPALQTTAAVYFDRDYAVTVLRPLSRAHAQHLRLLPDGPAAQERGRAGGQGLLGPPWRECKSAASLRRAAASSRARTRPPQGQARAGQRADPDHPLQERKHTPRAGAVGRQGGALGCVGREEEATCSAMTEPPPLFAMRAAGRVRHRRGAGMDTGSSSVVVVGAAAAAAASAWWQCNQFRLCEDARECYAVSDYGVPLLCLFDARLAPRRRRVRRLRQPVAARATRGVCALGERMALGAGGSPVCVLPLPQRCRPSCSTTAR